MYRELVLGNPGLIPAKNNKMLLDDLLKLLTYLPAMRARNQLGDVLVDAIDGLTGAIYMMPEEGRIEVRRLASPPPPPPPLISVCLSHLTIRNEL